MLHENAIRKRTSAVLFTILILFASGTMAVNTTQAQNATLTASTTRIIIAPPECEVCKPSKSFRVELSSESKNFGAGTLTYRYAVTGGRVIGEGRNVTWDLSGVSEGTYTATVDVESIKPPQRASAAHPVTVSSCSCDPKLVLPTITVNCPTDSSCDVPITFSVSVTNAAPDAKLDYNWTATNGTIVSGQGTPMILVEIDKHASSITAEVDVSGLDPSANRHASCSMRTFCDTPSAPTKVDELGWMNWGQLAARLDSFGLELINNVSPGELIFYIDQKTLPGQGQRFTYRLKDYLVKQKGIDASRITIKDGGGREQFAVELWEVPVGGWEPAPSPTVDLSERYKSAYLYDKYAYDCYPFFRRAGRNRTPCEGGPREPNGHSDALVVFGDALANTPGAKALIVVYPSRHDKRALINKFVQGERDFLVRKFKLDPANVLTKVGVVHPPGNVELWVVSPNAVAKPSLAFGSTMHEWLNYGVVDVPELYKRIASGNLRMVGRGSSN